MYIFLIIVIVILFFLIPTYQKPRVYKNLITEEERKHIIQRAEERFKPSSLASNTKIDKKVRDSETAWLDPNKDPVIKGVVEKCLSHCDRPLVNCEHLQVLRYKENGFYLPHYDACDYLSGCVDDKKMFDNKRLYTFLIALNDDYEGGHTIFPNINQRYKLQAGDVLKFNNLDNYGLVCSQALHGGEGVSKGTKYICNLWVHTYPYS